MNNLFYGYNLDLLQRKVASGSVAVYCIGPPLDLRASGALSCVSYAAMKALIRQIIVEFAEQFAAGSELLYAGQPVEMLAGLEAGKLTELGIVVGTNGKMPDVVLHDRVRNRLFLVDAVTSHGPIDGERREELRKLFGGATAALVFVSAFPDREMVACFLASIARGTEVWAAEEPSHLIHFNGDRPLGPREWSVANSTPASVPPADALASRP